MLCSTTLLASGWLCISKNKFLLHCLLEAPPTLCTQQSWALHSESL